MEKTVAIAECSGYGQEDVGRALDRLVGLLGGWGAFIRPGEQVVIKPNLLSAKKPEEAVTAHPSVVEAVARGIAGAGGKALIADSPGGPFNNTMLQMVYRASGMTGAAEAGGAELNYNTGETVLKVPAGGLLATLTVLEVLAGERGIVSVSKLKTHGMTRMTGAVKNLFGAIPGLKKAEYHVRMPGVDDFAGILLDITRTLAPRLHIMDAVVGMEGEGPMAGKPVQVGLLLASACPFALDLAAFSLAGVNLREVPTVRAAAARGLSGADLKGVRLLGDHVDIPRVRFRLPPGHRDVDLIRAGSGGRLPEGVLRAANRSLRPSPVFDPRTCRGCGNCSRACPPGAIKMEGKRPVADLDRCIRCFCCQELCPERAVSISRPWLGRVLFR